MLLSYVYIDYISTDIDLSYEYSRINWELQLTKDRLHAIYMETTSSSFDNNSSSALDLYKWVSTLEYVRYGMEIRT